MIIWLLLSILCFFLFKRFINKIEIREYGEWKNFTAPLWIWCVIVIFALLPILNFVALISFEIICIGDMKSTWGNTRFKQGESCCISKFLDLMNKEF